MSSASSDAPPTCLSDVESRELAWIWPGYLPYGCVTLVGGPTGAGKTTLLAAAAAYQTGAPLFGARREHPSRRVLWYTRELDVASMLRPRLLAAGVDVRHVLLPDHDARGQLTRQTSLPADGQRIADLAYQYDAGLVVFDPVSSYLGAGANPNDALAVRVLMESLQTLASSHGIAVLCAAHPRKGHVGSPMDWISGSAAWTQSVRQVVMMAPHPDVRGAGLLSVLKHAGADQPPAWTYRIESHDGGPRLALVEEATALAGELAEVGDLGDQHERADAMLWLTEELQEERETGEIYRRWSAMGYGRNLWWRVRRKLGVQVRRVGPRGSQQTFLYLPTPTVPHPPTDTHTPPDTMSEGQT